MSKRSESRLASLKRSRPSHFDDDIDYPPSKKKYSKDILKNTNPETILAAVNRLTSNNPYYDEDTDEDTDDSEITSYQKPTTKKRTTKRKPIQSTPSKKEKIKKRIASSTTTTTKRNSIKTPSKQNKTRNIKTKPLKQITIDNDNNTLEDDILLNEPIPEISKEIEKTKSSAIRSKKQSTNKKTPKPKKQYTKKTSISGITLSEYYLKLQEDKKPQTSKNKQIGKIILKSLFDISVDYSIPSNPDIYFPESEFSLPFLLSKTDDKPIVMPRLESCQINEKEKEKLIINAGGTIECMSWLPIRVEYEDNIEIPQYLAVGVHQEINPIHYYGKQNSQLNMIQIWCIYGLTTPWIKQEKEKNINQTAIFSIGICHSYGCVFQLEWCPLTSTYENESLSNQMKGKRSLGLLAAGFEDGSIRIFNVPHPDTLEEKNFIILQPIITFQNEGTIGGLKWKITENGAYLIWGNSNGMK